MAKKLDPKAKAKRQKIIAGVLGVLLLGVLAYEVPSLLKVMNKKPPPPPAIAATPAAGAPVTAAPAGAPVSAPATLADSDPAPQAGSGQLVSFDRFGPSKDPFVQQASVNKAAPAPSNTPPPPPLPPPPPPPPGPPATKPTSAKIAVNGVREDVKVGANFPSGDPVFTLVSLTKRTAKVGIAGGSLSTGTGTVTLTKGKKLTLMNTADGTRYELVLISVA
jgi:hypothetical protein